MLGHYHILMTYCFDARVLRFSIVWIYGMVIIRYQLILLIAVKWLLYTSMGNMSIHLYLLDLRMHWLIFNFI